MRELALVFFERECCHSIQENHTKHILEYESQLKILTDHKEITSNKGWLAHYKYGLLILTKQLAVLDQKCEEAKKNCPSGEACYRFMDVIFHVKDGTVIVLRSEPLIKEIT